MSFCIAKIKSYSIDDESATEIQITVDERKVTHGYKKFDKKRPFPALCGAQFAFRKANEETQLENIREFSKDCLPWDMLWMCRMELLCENLVCF